MASQTMSMEVGKAIQDLSVQASLEQLEAAFAETHEIFSDMLTEDADSVDAAYPNGVRGSLSHCHDQANRLRSRVLRLRDLVGRVQ